MARDQIIRAAIQQLVRAKPFCPFALGLENGDRVIVEHPENIAFEPDDKGHAGSEHFCVIANKLRVFSPFNAVASVTQIQRGQ